MSISTSIAAMHLLVFLVNNLFVDLCVLHFEQSFREGLNEDVFCVKMFLCQVKLNYLTLPLSLVYSILKFPLRMFNA